MLQRLERVHNEADGGREEDSGDQKMYFGVWQVRNMEGICVTGKRTFGEGAPWVSNRIPVHVCGEK